MPNFCRVFDQLGSLPLNPSNVKLPTEIFIFSAATLRGKPRLNKRNDSSILGESFSIDESTITLIKRGVDLSIFLPLITSCINTRVVCISFFTRCIKRVWISIIKLGTNSKSFYKIRICDKIHTK